MARLLFSLTLIIGGLVLGYTLRALTTLEYISLPLAIDDLRKILQKIGLLFFMPVSFLAAVWMVNFSSPKIMLVPLFGLLALVSGGVYGYLGARLMGAPPRQAGALFCCSSFTNIGAIGALEEGLTLKVIFILSSMPVAFNALVASSIYDLDLDLANSCWLISTIGLCW